MVIRKDSKKIYINTKHYCPYISHSYNNSNIIDKIFYDNNFYQKDWDNLDFKRVILIDILKIIN